MGFLICVWLSVSLFLFMASYFVAGESFTIGVCLTLGLIPVGMLLCFRAAIRFLKS